MPAVPARIVLRARRVTGQIFSDFTGAPVTVVQIERIATNATKWPRARFGASAWLIYSVGEQLQSLGYGGSGSEGALNDGLLSESCYSNVQSAPLQDDFVRIIDQGVKIYPSMFGLHRVTPE